MLLPILHSSTKYQLVDPQGAKSNVANVLINVSANLSDYRFEFEDANYSAGPKCQNYNGKNAFGRLTGSSWVNADFDFCYQLVKPIINCVGEGCLGSRFSFIVFKIVHSYINQVVLSGNGSSITNGC